LTKPGAKLLAMHACLDDSDYAGCRDTALAWANRRGLVEPDTVFRVSWYDDELGAECNAAFASREEAARERPECEIEQVEGWVGTGMLQSYANWAAPVSPVFVEEF